MSTKNTFNVLFFVRKEAKNKNDEVPIYCRITIKGKQTKFSINRNVKLDRWSPNSARHVKGTTEDAKILNYYIESVKSKLLQIHSELVSQGKLISPKIINDLFQGKTEKQKSLHDIFDLHLSMIKNLLGKGYVKSTLVKYQTTKKHVFDCLNVVYNKSDIYVSELNNAFIHDLNGYLRRERNCSHNSAMKYIKLFKSVLNFAEDKEYISRNPIARFKTTYHDVKRNALTLEELNQIESTMMSNVTLNETRDVFLFCCYTGLAYVDAYKLSNDHIELSHYGKKQISLARTKTSSACKVQLVDKAIDILNKYKNHPLCVNKSLLLPMISNQKYNVNLKQIARLCSINKNLTSHIARHTFATVLLNQDTPIEVVSKLLGHTKITTTQIYAKISDSNLSEKMNHFNEVLNAKTLKIA